VRAFFYALLLLLLGPQVTAIVLLGQGKISDNTGLALPRQDDGLYGQSWATSVVFVSKHVQRALSPLV